MAINLTKISTENNRNCEYENGRIGQLKMGRSQVLFN